MSRTTRALRRAQPRDTKGRFTKLRRRVQKGRKALNKRAGFLNLPAEQNKNFKGVAAASLAAFGTAAFLAQTGRVSGDLAGASFVDTIKPSWGDLPLAVVFAGFSAAQTKNPTKIALGALSGMAMSKSIRLGAAWGAGSLETSVGVPSLILCAVVSAYSSAKAMG